MLTSKKKLLSITKIVRAFYNMGLFGTWDRMRLLFRIAWDGMGWDEIIIVLSCV